LSSPGLSSSYGSTAHPDSSAAPSRREREETNEEDDGGNVSSSASASTSSDSASHHNASHSRSLRAEGKSKDQAKGDCAASRKRKRVFMSVSETSVSSSGSEGNERTIGIAPAGGSDRTVVAARSGGVSNSHPHPVRNLKEREDEQLTTVEGQLRKNPHMSEEEARIAAKREYNRRNAARARSRNKSLLQDLQDKVSKLNRFTEELQRTNDILRAQLELLSKQNETLMAEAAAASSSTSTSSQAPSDVLMPQQALAPQPAPLPNPSAPTAPLQGPPASQAQSLLNAVGLFSQLLQLQSLMNQAQQPQAQASQPPLPIQDQVSAPQAPLTPTIASSAMAVAKHGTTVTPSPTSRPLDGSAYAIAPSVAGIGGAEPPAAMAAEEGWAGQQPGVKTTHHVTPASGPSPPKT
jgi:hypothetical protein